MSRKSRNGKSNGEAALAVVSYEVRLAVSLAQIADGRAAPGQSNERAALRAIDIGWHGYRRLYCCWYGKCLDHAILAKWVGFTCRTCAVDEPTNDVQRIVEDRALLRSVQLFEAAATVLED